MEENKEARYRKQTKNYYHRDVKVKDLTVRINAEIYGEHYYKECKRYPPNSHSQEVVLNKDYIQNVKGYGQILQQLLQSKSVSKFYGVQR